MMADEIERDRVPTIRDLAQHPILAEFRQETRRRLTAIELANKDLGIKLAALEDRTAGQRLRLEAAERGYGEVNLVLGRIDIRSQERGEQIAKMETNVELALKTANNVHEVLRRTAWSTAGGIAVIGFLVGAWTLFVGPILSLLGKP